MTHLNNNATIFVALTFIAAATLSTGSANAHFLGQAKRKPQSTQKAPVRKGPAILAALPKGLAALEKVLGASQPYEGYETQRKFTLKGFSESYVDLEGEKVSFLVLRMENSQAEWQDYFKILGLDATGVEWQTGEEFMKTTKVKGLPEGWSITFMLNMDAGSKAIMNVQRIPTKGS